MTGYALVGVAVFAIGCTSPVRLVHPQPCSNYPKPPEELLAPRPELPFIPPMPVPSTVQGREVLVRVIVDTTGRVMQDLVMICGIGDPLYLQRVAEEVSAMRFRPGLMHAKHVIAPTTLGFKL